LDILNEDTTVKITELGPPLNALITEVSVESRRLADWDADG
jgi:hypothetical protein